MRPSSGDDHRRYALSIGATSADAVALILRGQREKPVDLFCLDGRPQLKALSIPLPDLSAYRSLQVGA